MNELIIAIKTKVDENDQIHNRQLYKNIFFNICNDQVCMVR